MIKIRPAATILLLRETDQNTLELLLLRRNRKLKFGPGFWVFPGGKIEEADREASNSDMEAAKLAAVREAKEEASVILDPKNLLYFCHWTTPDMQQPRRFSTSFFYTLLPSDQTHKVVVDDSEIKEHLWISPKEALRRCDERQLPLMPPTYIAIQRISNCKDTKEIITELSKFQPKVLPTIDVKDQTIYCMYEGDAGFVNGKADTPGARHRLVGAMDGNYQFIYEDCEVAAVNGGNHKILNPIQNNLNA